MARILVTDPISKPAQAALSDAGFDIQYSPTITAEELLTAISDVDGVICRARTKLTAEVISAAQNCKVIANASTGTDHIDLSACDTAGIPVKTVEVVNGMTPNTVATAEHTVLLILAALKNLKPAMHNAESGNWQSDLALGNELFEKTVGIIGLGKIGQFVAQRLAPFDVKILASDPIITPDVAESVGATLAPLDELLAQADVITIHVPKIPQTIGMINSETLAKTKTGVTIVNTSRGEIIDAQALADALQSGQVGRAALDVFLNETSGGDTILINHPNVIATPHIAGITKESLNRMSLQAAQAMLDFFRT